MNVCGYVRVSSDGQTENYSIPQQQKAILHSLIKKIVLQGGTFSRIAFNLLLILPFSLHGLIYAQYVTCFIHGVKHTHHISL